MNALDECPGALVRGSAWTVAVADDSSVPFEAVKRVWSLIFAMPSGALETASLLLLHPLEFVMAALDAPQARYKELLLAVFARVFIHGEVTTANLLSKIKAIMLPSWRYPTEVKGLIRDKLGLRQLDDVRIFFLTPAPVLVARQIRNTH